MVAAGPACGLDIFLLPWPPGAFLALAVAMSRIVNRGARTRRKCFLFLCRVTAVLALYSQWLLVILFEAGEMVLFVTAGRVGGRASLRLFFSCPSCSREPCSRHPRREVRSLRFFLVPPGRPGRPPQPAGTSGGCRS